MTPARMLPIAYVPLPSNANLASLLLYLNGIWTRFALCPVSTKTFLNVPSAGPFVVTDLIILHVVISYKLLPPSFGAAQLFLISSFDFESTQLRRNSVGLVALHAYACLKTYNHARVSGNTPVTFYQSVIVYICLTCMASKLLVQLYRNQDFPRLSMMNS